MRSRTSGVVVIALLACDAHAQQTILVPQHQPTIEAAIAAAVDGDRIQLTQSAYTIGVNGLTLAKSLVLETIGTARATISYPDSPLAGGGQPYTSTIHPALRITGFGTGARIALRNVTFDGGYSAWAHSPLRPAVIDVQLANAAGELVLEGVEAIGETRHQDDACPGLRVASGPNVRVVLRNSRFEGAEGQSPMLSTGEVAFEGSDGAIVAAQGPFAAEACRFIGGAGGDAIWGMLGPYVQARNGGAAAQLNAPLGVLEWCELFEGTPGRVWASTVLTPPVNPCTMYGAPGASTLTTEVYDCTRTFTLSGCGQTPQTVALNQGRSDVQPIAPALPGVPFPISFRSLPASTGLTFWIFGSGLDSLALPGFGGRLYVANAFLVGLLSPPGPTGWSTITFPAPPAALPFLPCFAVQPLHFDYAGSLQFGAVATFTVLVP